MNLLSIVAFFLFLFFQLSTTVTEQRELMDAICSDDIGRVENLVSQEPQKLNFFSAVRLAITSFKTTGNFNIVRTLVQHAPHSVRPYALAQAVYNAAGFLVEDLLERYPELEPNNIFYKKKIPVLVLAAANLDHPTLYYLLKRGVYRGLHTQAFAELVTSNSCPLGLGQYPRLSRCACLLFIYGYRIGEFVRVRPDLFTEGFYLAAASHDGGTMDFFIRNYRGTRLDEHLKELLLVAIGQGNLVMVQFLLSRIKDPQDNSMRIVPRELIRTILGQPGHFEQRRKEYQAILELVDKSTK